MKVRHPKEFAAAVTKIKSALSEQTCASIVGRSDSLVRKWADPDHPSQPNLMQGLLLDSAYVRAGHGEAPLLTLYEKLLDDDVTGSSVGREEIVPSALMVQAIVGDLSEAIRESIGSGEMREGVGLTPNRRAALLALIDRLEAETDRLEDAVEAGEI